jgi:hypothetical protein
MDTISIFGRMDHCYKSNEYTSDKVLEVQTNANVALYLKRYKLRKQERNLDRIIRSGLMRRNQVSKLKIEQKKGDHKFGKHLDSKRFDSDNSDSSTPSSGYTSYESDNVPDHRSLITSCYRGGKDPIELD